MAGILFDFIVLGILSLFPSSEGRGDGTTFIPFEENHTHNYPNQQTDPNYIDNFPSGFEDFGSF